MKMHAKGVHYTRANYYKTPKFNSNKTKAFAVTFKFPYDLDKAITFISKIELK